MNIFLDTNVVLDHILEREPHYEASSAAIQAALERKYVLYVSASCITDIFYIARRYGIDTKDIKEQLGSMLSFVDIIGITRSDILKALRIECDDLEDALQAQCAAKIKADYIITRDTDFNGYGVKVVSPKEFIECLDE